MFFELLCVIHVLVWLFVLTAFLNRKTAYFNVYYLIPFIYLIHILPFHIIISLKQYCHPVGYEYYENAIYESMIIPKIFRSITSSLEKFCFASPLSTQGMLIFGLITSIFVLYPPKYL
jgi:hypothetical protein